MMMMNSQSIQFELEAQRKRLDYYRQLKDKSPAGKTVAANKWIEIHAERVQKLERQLSRAQQQAAAASAQAASPVLKTAQAPAKAAAKKKAGRR